MTGPNLATRVGAAITRRKPASAPPDAPSQDTAPAQDTAPSQDAAPPPAAAGPGRPSPAGAKGSIPRRKVVSENELPGDPNWGISHLGRPEAMMGYAGQYSALPGDQITLYASTTARSFTVRAFRMGWYRGDQARLVWRSGTVRGHRQSPSTLTAQTNTVAFGKRLYCARSSIWAVSNSDRSTPNVA